ncbi:MAG: manganese efflux pump [Clostridia bacterium]|nr:manganese efflux pump [Clostridia bacterium]
MDFVSIVLIAVSLSMDALAVALSTGMCMKKAHVRDGVRIGLYFGGFQFAMPVAGWLLGRTVASAVQNVDHWIAFGLLVLLGGKMLYEAVRAKMNDEECPVDPVAHRRLFILAIATSIDALAVGVGFAFMQVRILPASLVIGIITFTLSAAGCLLGKKLGGLFRKYAEIAGGLVLIGIGVRILVEHLAGA